MLTRETAGGLTTLTLTRPDRRNALTEDLRAALSDAIDAACRAGSRVLLIRSHAATPPTFAAGADLADIAALRTEHALAFAERGQALYRKLEDAALFTLAAVDGTCLGGALDLALACDGILCTERASFGHPGAGLGIVTGWGGTRRLPRAIGSPAAAGLFSSGRRLDAHEALALGLVWELLPTEGFQDETAHRALELASSLAAVPAWEVASAKGVLAAATASRRRLDLARGRALIAARSGDT